MQPLSVTREANMYNKVEIQVRKYAHSPRSNLEASVQLDWEIYQNVKRIFRPSTADGSSNNGHVELLIFRYLQDWNETLYNARLWKATGAETVITLARNPLGVYLTFWRFENYIKKLLRLDDQRCQLCAEVRDYIGKVYNDSDGPLSRDLEDAMDGVLTTQFVHDWKAQDVGKLPHLNFGSLGFC